MPVKEIRQSYGSWGFSLRPHTPREILDTIKENPFGHIAVIPGRVSPQQYRDGLLELARYVGVYRAFFNQPDGHFEIKGTGMAFWLGDEDDKGDVPEAPVSFVNETFADTIRGLLPANGAIVEGTLFNVPGGQLYTGTHRFQPPRKSLTYVTDTFSTPEQLVEWRVNGNGTLDAGPISELYRMIPRTILVEKDAGRELLLAGLQATLSNDFDVEDYTTRVLLLGEGEGGSVATGSADAPATPYKDIHGNSVRMTRVISESGTSGVNADIRAQVELNKRMDPRRAAQISTDEYDVKGDLVVGDYIYVFDPEGGFIDLNQQAFWRGVPINPIRLRVVEMTWPIRAEWTVAFRTNLGEWIDLSEYYRPETGSTYLQVGDFLRTLAGGGGTEPVTSRPPGDSSIPAAPVFGTFSTGSYQPIDEDWTKAAILATWAQPLNLDGSTIVDGSHYELRYRVNAFIGYGIRWGVLADHEIEVEDSFSRIVAPGSSGSWGNATPSGDAWTVEAPTSQFEVDGSAGLHHIGANSTFYRSRLAALSLNKIDMTYRFFLPTLPTGSGAFIRTEARVRFVDVNNHVAFRFIINPDASVDVDLVTRTSSVETVTSVATGVVHDVGTALMIRLRAFGGKLYASIWPSGQPAPNVWTATADDPLPAVFGPIELVTYAESLTNVLPITVSYDDVKIVDLTADGFRWGELATNKWGAPITDPIDTSNEWHVIFIGWGQSQHMVTELTPGVEYEFQIRAVDAANPPHQGPWSASKFVMASGDLFAPSTPASPLVASSMVAIQVVHQLGKNSGGIFNLEPDLAYLSVHVGGSESFHPDDSNVVGKLVANAGMIQAQIPAVGTFQIAQVDEVWVKVMAVDFSGNKSGASPPVQATVELIDNAHISDLTVSKVTAGTITAAWILAGSIKTANTGARVEIDGSGIRTFKSDGTQTVDIDSGTGEVEIRGHLIATGELGAQLSMEPTLGGDDPHLRLLPNNAVGREGHLATFVSGSTTITEISNVNEITKTVEGGFGWFVKNNDGTGEIFLSTTTGVGEILITTKGVTNDTYIFVESDKMQFISDGVVRLDLPATRPSVGGSAGGNAALFNLISALQGMGLILWTGTP